MLVNCSRPQHAPSGKTRAANDWFSTEAGLYYNNSTGSFAWTLMTHHHHGTTPHPAAAISPSLLRFSVLQRLAIAGALVALIWTAFWWAAL
jgi:hypothetical protein